MMSPSPAATPTPDRSFEAGDDVSHMLPPQQSQHLPASSRGPSPSAPTAAQHLTTPSAGASRSPSPSGGGASSHPLILAAGRSTPSPLPSLQELRQLHRANSARGRSQAMDKLTGRGGGGDARRPDEDAAAATETLQLWSHDGGNYRGDQQEESDRAGTGFSAAGSVGLRRAGTLGGLATTSSSSSSAGRLGAAGTGLDVGLLGRRVGIAKGYAAPSADCPAELLSSTAATEHDPFIAPPAAVAVGAPPRTRPILGRSNTISTGDGSERRSVIGRRMMERLGGRVAMAAASGGGAGVGGGNDAPPLAAATGLAGLQMAALQRRQRRAAEKDDDREDASSANEMQPAGVQSSEVLASPTPPPAHSVDAAQLSAPDAFLRPADAAALGRSPSQASQRTEGDSWEYEAHLRRSISARKAKMLQDVSFDAVTTIGSEPVLDEELQPQQQYDATSPPRQAQVGGEPRAPSTPARYDDADEDESSPLRPRRDGSPTLASPPLLAPALPMQRIPVLLSSTPATQPRIAHKIAAASRREDSMSSFPVEIGSEHTSSVFGTPGQSSDLRDRVADESTVDEHAAQTATSPHLPLPATPDDASRDRSPSVMSWLDVSAGEETPTDPTYSQKTASASSSLVMRMKGSMKKSISGLRDASPGVSGRSTPIPGADSDSTTAQSVVLTSGHTSPMPSADPLDPRMRSAKLFPAPSLHAPPMLQQASDSILPTLQNALQDGSRAPAPTTALPLESVGKKTWLAEAFFAPTGAGFLQTPRQQHVELETQLPALPLKPATAPKTQQVLDRLDAVLALEGDRRPDVLDDPPRRLVAAMPVLQVVNQNNVKHRHLMLFSDLLVIAKPLEPEAKSGLDGPFAVKSIVHLRDLHITSATDESSQIDSSRHPIVLEFIALFKRDPEQAISYLLSRSQLERDDDMVAGLLFKSPELDKAQIGRYLARHPSILEAYVSKFDFTDTKLVDALRVFLLSLRLPAEPIADERLLCALAAGWHAANAGSLPFKADLAEALVRSIMQLNDSLHPQAGFGFAFPNPMIRPDDFVTAFVAKDPEGLVTAATLDETYTSVRAEPILQALAGGQSQEVTLTPSRLPTRMTLDVWSEPITISIPKPDASFAIKLQGQDLVVEPSVLDFATSCEQTFRVKGVALGARSLLFSRTGSHAPLYADLANTKTFLIERKFMQSTLNVAFVNHAGIRRKYCYSFDDEATKAEFLAAIVERKKRQKPVEGPQRAAEAASLSVLQTTLIAKDDAQDNQKAQPGKDVVLICRQNSLLPIVLGLIHRIGGGQ